MMHRSTKKCIFARWKEQRYNGITELACKLLCLSIFCHYNLNHILL